MSVTVCEKLGACAVISASLILFSCSTASNAPKVGTPEFYWAAAKETYAAGDYQKTVEHLDRLLATNNQYTAQAQPWLLVLTSGMSRGYMDMANAFEAGAKANRSDPLSFRRQVNNFRGQASQLTLHFAEVFGDFMKNKDEYVPIGFSYPSGLPTPVLALTKVGNGIPPTPADLENIQKRSLERSVLLTTCDAVGAPEDPAKAQDLMKSPNPKVPRAAFVMAMANLLYDQSQLYTRQRLDQPDKAKVLCARAQEALKTIPESKQTKELNGKIESALKKMKS